MICKSCGKQINGQPHVCPQCHQATIPATPKKCTCGAVLINGVCPNPNCSVVSGRMTASQKPVS